MMKVPIQSTATCIPVVLQDLGERYSPPEEKLIRIEEGPALCLGPGPQDEH